MRDSLRHIFIYLTQSEMTQNYLLLRSERDQQQASGRAFLTASDRVCRGPNNLNDGVNLKGDMAGDLALTVELLAVCTRR